MKAEVILSRLSLEVYQPSAVFTVWKMYQSPNESMSSSLFFIGTVFKPVVLYGGFESQDTKIRNVPIFNL